MIEAKVKNGNVTVRIEGLILEPVGEAVIIVLAILNNLKNQDSEAAEVFKDVIRLAFELDRVWSTCDGGNGK